MMSRTRLHNFVLIGLMANFMYTREFILINLPLLFSFVWFNTSTISTHWHTQTQIMASLSSNFSPFSQGLVNCAVLNFWLFALGGEVLWEWSLVWLAFLPSFPEHACINYSISKKVQVDPSIFHALHPSPNKKILDNLYEVFIYTLVSVVYNSYRQKVILIKIYSSVLITSQMQAEIEKQSDQWSI